MLRKIWKKYNNSFVFILPLFNDITKHIEIRDTNISYPFIELAVEYGLINTYLYKNNKYQNCLYLQFDREKLNTNKLITNKKINSLLELLLCSEYYDGFFIDGDVYVSFKIDKKYNNDIDLIENSNYSKVSDDFRKKIDIGQKMVAKCSDIECEYIAKYNLGYNICKKSPIVKEMLESELHVKIDKEQELYEKFNKKKENWK